MIILHKLIAQDITVDTNDPYVTGNANRQVIDLPTTPEKIKKFFVKHIENSNRASYRKVCKFSNSTGLVLTECLAIVSNTLNTDQPFIDASIHMTHSLHNAMVDSTSKSSGTMIYIIYEDDVLQENFLGIFKMDKNDAVQFNKASNNFILYDNVLPSLKEKLHKTAIVKLKANLFMDTVHLYVMDKQQSADRGPSKFFINRFLEAEEIMNNQKATTVIMTTLKETVSEGGIQEITDGLEFSKSVDLMLSKGREFDFDIEVDRLLQPYVKGEADRELYIASMKDRILNQHRDIPLAFKTDIKQAKYTFSDSNDVIRLQFPKIYKGNRVVIEYDGPDTVIRVAGLHLEEKS